MQLSAVTNATLQLPGHSDSSAPCHVLIRTITTKTLASGGLRQAERSLSSARSVLVRAGETYVELDEQLGEY